MIESYYQKVANMDHEELEVEERKLKEMLRNGDCSDQVLGPLSLIKNLLNPSVDVKTKSWIRK